MERRGDPEALCTSPAASTSSRRPWSSPSTTCSTGTAWRRNTAASTTDFGLGTTIWSPLASGFLTGKYCDGIPEGSRFSLQGYHWLRKRFEGPSAEAKIEKVQQARPAGRRELGITLPQLAIAWCLKNPHVSSVITGASRPEQVVENMKAVDAVKLLDGEVMAKIEKILTNAPEAELDFRS